MIRNPTRRRAGAVKVVREATFYLVLTAFGLLMLLPLLWSASTALKPDNEILASPIHWIPAHLTFKHFVEAFTLVPFPRYFLNSTIIAVAGVITNLFLGSLAGYAYAQMRFKGRGLLFRAQLGSMMVPGVITLIPTFLILRMFPFAGGNNVLGQGGTGLLNTYWGVILPGAAGAFAVFLMRQFFLTLPRELGEAARIEGAGEFRIFWSIYLPLSKPALATLAIFTFQAGWNVFLWPLIVFNDPSMYTVQLGLQAFTYNHSTQYGPMMAASIVVMLPIIIVFLAMQRYFVRGIAFTGTK